MEEIIKKVEEHEKLIDFIARTAADHTERLDRIEHKLEKLDGIESDVKKVVGTLDSLSKLINRHDDEIVAINYNHKMFDRRVEILEQKV